jgi:hypothetical protein
MLNFTAKKGFRQSFLTQLLKTCQALLKSRTEPFMMADINYLGEARLNPNALQ